MMITDPIMAPCAPPKSIWRNRAENERVGWVKDCFIAHPDVVRIHEDAVQKLEHCKQISKSDAMLIVGGSGSGKTTLTQRLKSFAETLYGYRDPERTICPVIQIPMPDPCVPVEISVAVLEALNDPLPRYGSRVEIFQRSKKLLTQCEVRLVLIDNIHDAPTRRGMHGMKLAGARIRDLMDASAALWILLGTADAIRVRNSDPQLVKRVPYEQSLSYFSIGTTRKAAAFKRLLIELDKWLPLAEASCLADSSLIGPVFLATEGILDRLISLASRACVEAVRAGREFLMKVDLRKAFDHLVGTRAGKDNPFSEEFSNRRLHGQGEPYEILRSE